MGHALDGVTVVKVGGELLETPARAEALARALSPLASDGPLVVVHGGGREIDAECARRGLTKVAVDGLRVTDAATLDAVVAALAGTINTRFVAALVLAGLRAVGLTGADAACVRVVPAPAYRATDGRDVDLGFVGQPLPAHPPALVGDLVGLGYVPVLACLGTDSAGGLFNVNADTLAAHVAAACGAARLLVAGGTPGVLDRDGATIAELTLEQAQALVADGTASAGMVAKLSACCDAVRAGVPDVRIVAGATAATLDLAPGTRLTGAARPHALLG
jgi:acetylglutamate kinase